MNTIDMVRNRLGKKSARVQQFMQSEIGREIIEILEAEFYHGDLFDNDPQKTAFNLGRRDVVVYLKQLQNWRNNNE